MKVAVVLLSVASAAASACARDEAAPICPPIVDGDLVITEIHGDHGTAWIELFNASGAAIDLEGTRIRFEKLDGSSEIDALIRHPLPVAAAAYTVLGDVGDDARPAFVDYGFANDWHGTGWLDGAAVSIEACGARIDRVIYDSLPTQGSYSLGASPPSAPSATANDLPANWCIDSTADGTPQQANPICP